MENLQRKKAEKQEDSGRLEGRGLEAASDFSDCLWSVLSGGTFGQPGRVNSASVETLRKFTVAAGFGGDNRSS